MIGRNDPCWCGSGKKWKKCHYPTQPKVVGDELKARYRRQHQIIIKDDEQIAGIRNASKLAAQILDATSTQARAGVTTAELNAFANQMHQDAGAVPAPLHYGTPPFPASICTSINDVICHGIPNDIPLIDGDIINIDITVILNGYYGDCSKMTIIGGKTERDRQLVTDVSYECLMRSIAILKPGVLTSQIGEVIEEYAHAQGCSVVNQFVAHGVGVEFHEGPQIPHCRNSSHIELLPGMIFTIEPMINAGVRDAIIDPDDKWTARTRDGKPSAQWEHTLLITDSGHEILTHWSH